MIALRIREAGDAAVLLELDEVLDADVNARAISIAAAVEREHIRGVRDVVPTYRTVAVHFDPLRVDTAHLRSTLHDVGELTGTPSEGRRIEVGVVYGGEDGPDLHAVAAFAGCSPGDVIERHAAREYRVFMLGFLPGFAYMGTVDPSIAVPRRPAPRQRVPARSVGIAGAQTGIYPADSPGGWQIIGRAVVPIFEAGRLHPALFAPGDRVRFVPVDGSTDAVPATGPLPAASAGESGSGAERSRPSRHITIVRQGLLTTVQDRGRWGYQAAGVPVSGAMDVVAHRTANAIVGNPPDAATLEATLIGPAIRIDTPATIAIAGADLGAAVEGLVIPLHQPVECPAGSTVTFGQRASGARATVALDGGIATVPVLGSRSTHASGVLGPAPLQRGDRVPLGSRTAPSSRWRRLPLRPVHTGGAKVRILAGPHLDFFVPAALELLQTTRFRIAAASNRMGYRLTADRALPRVSDREMISDATVSGAIQVPSSGDPILLMADRQTTGGYPIIATVITADLPLAAQLAPGDWIEFGICSRQDALAALVAQETTLLAWS